MITSRHIQKSNFWGLTKQVGPWKTTSTDLAHEAHGYDSPHNQVQEVRPFQQNGSAAPTYEVTPIFQPDRIENFRGVASQRDRSGQSLGNRLASLFKDLQGEQAPHFPVKTVTQADENKGDSGGSEGPDPKDFVTASEGQGSPMSVDSLALSPWSLSQTDSAKAPNFSSIVPKGVPLYRPSADTLADDALRDALAEVISDDALEAALADVNRGAFTQPPSAIPEPIQILESPIVSPKPEGTTGSSPSTEGTTGSSPISPVIWPSIPSPVHISPISPVHFPQVPSPVQDRINAMPEFVGSLQDALDRDIQINEDRRMAFEVAGAQEIERNRQQAAAEVPTKTAKDFADRKFHLAPSSSGIGKRVKGKKPQFVGTIPPTALIHSSTGGPSHVSATQSVGLGSRRFSGAPISTDILVNDGVLSAASSVDTIFDIPSGVSMDGENSPPGSPSRPNFLGRKRRRSSVGGGPRQRRRVEETLFERLVPQVPVPVGPRRSTRVRRQARSVTDTSLPTGRMGGQSFARK